MAGDPGAHLHARARGPALVNSALLGFCLALLAALPAAAGGEAAAADRASAQAGEPSSRVESPPPAEAGQGRAFRLEDLYLVRHPQEIALSPDGRHLAYSLGTTELARARALADLYRLDLDSGAVRRLTWSRDVRESSPRWSPDGRHLAYLAEKEGSTQAWLMPMEGGEPRALTDLATGVEGPLLFAGGGSRLVFTSRVYPRCGADPSCNAEEHARRKEGPLRAHLADELLYRHWSTWGEGRVRRVLSLDIESGALALAEPASGEGHAPALGLGPRGYDAMAEGDLVAFTERLGDRAGHAWSTNTDVVLAPLPTAGATGAGGGSRAGAGSSSEPNELRVISAANEAWDGIPRFSPEGRHLAWLAQRMPGYESDLKRLVVANLESGERRELGAELPNTIESYAWLPHGRGLLALVPERGRSAIWKIPLSGQRAQRVWIGAHVDELVPAADPRRAIVVRRAVHQPPEIWEIPLDARGKERRLTWHNAALEREVDLRPAIERSVPVPGGDPVQVFLVTPHGFDPTESYPLIVNVHGGPQMQWSDAFRGDWQVYPGAGYVVAFLNPTGSTGFGPELTRAISGEWGGRVMEEIVAVTDALAAEPWIDEERVGAMGWSWGGYAMAWLNGESGHRFRALASMMGIFDLPSFYGATEELWFPEWDLSGRPWDSEDYRRFNPASRAEEMDTPTLIIAGERDYRVPYTQSLQLFTALRRQEVPARLIVLPDSGHWPSWYEMALYYTAHLEWFARWLGGQPPPWSVADFAANRVFDAETGARIDAKPSASSSPERPSPGASGRPR